MKKRAKIITTVASLCLAVALMAFGVYAATQVTLSISSEVEFTVTDVFVTINGQAYLANTAEGAAYEYVSYETVGGVRTAKSSGQDNQAETWALADIAYLANKTEVKYVIRVANDHATDSVTVSLTGLQFKSIANTKRAAQVTYWDATGNDYEEAEANGTAETANVANDYAFTTSSFTVLPGKYVEFILIRTLIDNSVAIPANSVSLAGNLTVAHVANA